MMNFDPLKSSLTPEPQVGNAVSLPRDSPLPTFCMQPSLKSFAGEPSMQLESNVNILMVDDHPENLLALEAVLAGLGANLVKAHSGQEALRCLLHQDFAVILLDVQMPEMDGFETAALIRSRARSRETPIIFLTAFSTSEQLMFRGYSLGAVDYLHKPIDAVILTSKVTVFVDLYKKTEALQRQTAQLESINTQLEAMNSKLRRSEERFRSLSACSPVGIFVTNTAGCCVYSNARCFAICELKQDSSLEDAFRTVHPDDRANVLHGWTAYLQGRQEYSVEFRVQTPQSGDRWVHVRAAPMQSGQGTPLGHVGTVEDITERKQAEAVRHQVVREQAARQEAEAANRMKDEFLAVLSHELRTPLNSMLGWARLLRTRKFDEATTARALETIERNATAQAQLIEDILDVSQIIRGKMRLNCGPANLVGIIDGAIESVRPALESKQLAFAVTILYQGEPLGDLKAEVQNPRFNVWADAVRLQQVIWNLLSNAIKFTDEQGRIEVRLDRCCGSATALNSMPPTIAVAEPPAPFHFHPSEYLQIQVRDTGVGISPEFLPQVFDRFRQADSTTTRSHTGLGLGLAIVRHIVEQQGGSVQAESAGEGQGSTFTVALPVLQRLEPVDLPEADEAAIAPVALETEAS
jgi:PAS domain S-box-containing protein